MNKLLLIASIILTSYFAHAEEAGPFSIGRYSLNSSNYLVELQGLTVKMALPDNAGKVTFITVKAVLNVNDQTIHDKLIELKKIDGKVSIVYDPSSNVSQSQTCLVRELGYPVDENNGDGTGKVVCYEVVPSDIIVQ